MKAQRKSAPDKPKTDRPDPVPFDFGAIGRLEELRIRGRDAVPAERVEIGGKQPRRIEASCCDPVPRLPVEEFRVQFGFPLIQQL